MCVSGFYDLCIECIIELFNKLKIINVECVFFFYGIKYLKI